MCKPCNLISNSRSTQVWEVTICDTEQVLLPPPFFIILVIYLPKHMDGLVQERRNSSALAMVLRLSFTNPSMLSISSIPFISDYFAALLYKLLYLWNPYHCRCFPCRNTCERMFVSKCCGILLKPQVLRTVFYFYLYLAKKVQLEVNQISRNLFSLNIECE